MKPVLFELSGIGFRITGFGVMFLLACAGALAITVWRAKREGIDSESVYELAIWLFSGGVIGARACFVLQYPEEMRSFADIFKVWQGGLVFYGCIVGGFAATLIHWWRRPFPFLKMADAVAPALAWGAGVGRLGCFLNGCCYGEVSGHPWACAFPAGTIPWYDQLAHGVITPFAAYSLPVHPTQLYSAFAGLGLVILALVYHSRRRFDGEVMTFFMVGYAVSRFWVESLRADQTISALGMTFSQVVSLVVFLGGVGGWIWLWLSATSPRSTPRISLAEAASTADSTATAACP